MAESQHIFWYPKQSCHSGGQKLNMPRLQSTKFGAWYDWPVHPNGHSTVKTIQSQVLGAGDQVVLDCSQSLAAMMPETISQTR